MDCSLPGSSVHGILPARILEWVAIPFSRGTSQPRNQTGGSPALQADSLPAELPVKPCLKVKSLSRVPLFVTPWTVAYQAPLSMGFSRQEYWSGLPFPFPGDLSDPGIEPSFPTLQADALPSESPGKPRLLSP